jgi:hypothetical protein
MPIIPAGGVSERRAASEMLARKRVEEVFDWVKTVAGDRKLRCCGVECNRFWMEMTTAGYNLARLAKLIPAVG